MSPLNRPAFSQNWPASKPIAPRDDERGNLSEVTLRDVSDWVNLCRLCAEPDAPRRPGTSHAQAVQSDENIPNSG